MARVAGLGAGWVNPWRLTGWGFVATVLLAPLIAMRFTSEVAWTAADFAFAGGLLVGAGLLLELMLWKVRGLGWRLALGGLIVAAVLLVWADGAVGLF